MHTIRSLHVGKLLQPSAQRRVRLREVMEHPWITKDGSQPLYPYKYIPPDQSTQQNVSFNINPLRVSTLTL